MKNSVTCTKTIIKIAHLQTGGAAAACTAEHQVRLHDAQLVQNHSFRLRAIESRLLALHYWYARARQHPEPAVPSQM